jgi:hypothetical protein
MEDAMTPTVSKNQQMNNYSIASQRECPENDDSLGHVYAISNLIQPI